MNMKYWLSRWFISQKHGRFSVGYQDPQIEEIIDDSKYKNLYEGFCTQYIFKSADDSSFLTDKVEAFDMTLFSKEEARQWILDNMNIKEISPYVFEVSPAQNIGGISLPQRLFIL